jgi:hypothetical protein
MRWIYLAIIILFAAATIIFALQNLEIGHCISLRLRCSRPARTVGRYRLPTGRGDRRQPVCAAAPIVRRFKAQVSGLAMIYGAASFPTSPSRVQGECSLVAP